MVIIDTQIPSNTDRRVLKAFFHGHIHGEYKIYRDDEEKKLSIKFTDGEDASSFKLKELDKIYVEQFHQAAGTSSLNLDDLFKDASKTPPTQYPWTTTYPQYDPFRKIGTSAIEKFNKYTTICNTTPGV